VSVASIDGLPAFNPSTGKMYTISLNGNLSTGTTIVVTGGGNPNRLANFTLNYANGSSNFTLSVNGNNLVSQR